MNSYRVAGILLLALWAAPATSDEDSANVSTDLSGMRTETSYTGHHYKITWSRVEFDGRKISKWMGGDSFDPPRYVFESVGVRVDGTEVTVPKSLYRDIYDPHSYGPFVMDDGQFLYLVIKAGDGAGSAEAWMRIEGSQIVMLKTKV